MKFLRQFAIIMAITCSGELLRYLLPLPIPAGVYGLLLMFLLLFTKVLRVDQVKETAYFLIEIMPLMFIPAAVGIVADWQTLSAVFLPVLLITLLTTAIVMVSAGRITQFIIGFRRSDRNFTKGAVKEAEKG